MPPGVPRKATNATGDQLVTDSGMAVLLFRQDTLE